MPEHIPPTSITFWPPKNSALFVFWGGRRDRLRRNQLNLVRCPILLIINTCFCPFTFLNLWDYIMSTVAAVQIRKQHLSLSLSLWDKNTAWLGFYCSNPPNFWPADEDTADSPGDVMWHGGCWKAKRAWDVSGLPHRETSNPQTASGFSCIPPHCLLPLLFQLIAVFRLTSRRGESARGHVVLPPPSLLSVLNSLPPSHLSSPTHMAYLSQVHRRRLFELLQEQQEPFLLDVYLLERGYSERLLASQSTCPACWPGNPCRRRTQKLTGRRFRTRREGTVRNMLSKLFSRRATKNALHWIDTAAVPRVRRESPISSSSSVPVSRCGTKSCLCCFSCFRHGKEQRFRSDNKSVRHLQRASEGSLHSCLLSAGWIEEAVRSIGCASFAPWEGSRRRIPWDNRKVRHPSKEEEEDEVYKIKTVDRLRDVKLREGMGCVPASGFRHWSRDRSYHFRRHQRRSNPGDDGLSLHLCEEILIIVAIWFIEFSSSKTFFFFFLFLVCVLTGVPATKALTLIQRKGLQYSLNTYQFRFLRSCVQSYSVFTIQISSFIYILYLNWCYCV